MPIRNPTNWFSGISSRADDIYDQDIEGYCQNCLQVGVKSPLQKRVYKFDKDSNKPIVEPEDDKWRQCYHCGDIVPIYDVKHEPKLADFVETSNDPFDSIKSNKMEVLNQSASEAIADKRNPIKRKYKQRRDAISSIKDDEIRQLLEKGAELIYLNES